MLFEQFHSAVSSWFLETFPRPTQCQSDAWPWIKSERHTLIAAPTGSGKTLAAFLASIDALVRKGIKEGLSDETLVLYISPLKALSNDIQRNLEQPLEGIGKHLVYQGFPNVLIRALVRTGDTTAAARAAMIKRPPHILVTTPESFYILLTSDGGRRMLKTVSTVIVDEIHALVGSKRGSHLSLSLERLETLTDTSLTRIGLSATQRPIEEVARFLIGNRPQSTECKIIDHGHRRELDIEIEVPDSPLEALLSGQAAGEIYDKLATLIRAHETTLVFVNTRRMAERVSRHLSERIGDENITSHHGSLAREQRLSREYRLKSGELQALVATASLELGIDIGEIDLVCQIGTTRSIATLVQRVGLSGHDMGAIPKGRLFPTSRDELIECIALLDSVRRNELDQLVIPTKPMDVLAQQLVAMLACEDWNEDALYAWVCQAYPYRDLSRDEFDQVILTLVDGFNTQRGRRSTYLHRDPIDKILRARRGARLTAMTCGGAIPDNADYRVILNPGDEFIGTVDEDFAIECLVGDIFQLGNNSWRVLRVEAGNLRVDDAQNQAPSIPFWFGEAPGRTQELSYSVSRIREEVASRCDKEQEGSGSAFRWLVKEVGINAAASEQAVNYINAARIALGAIPSFNTLIIERFFDESGGMQLILHSPFGNRLNRAWGLALRKRFCRTFNFELQAAATEDAIILSLSTAHSFSLEKVTSYLHSSSVRNVLIQALLDAPMFTIRWRWNATCALAIKRFQNGKKVAPYLIRMQADDLVAAIFPEQMACLENIAGDRAIPEHPLVQQTIEDCLTEAMDVGRLIDLLKCIESGSIQVIARDLVEPSPLAAEILTARNYAFLDGAPAEERRTRAVASRRWLDPKTASDLGRLEPDAITRVRKEVWPVVTTTDELYDALKDVGFIDENQEAKRVWFGLFEKLKSQQRAMCLHLSEKVLWVSVERLPLFVALFENLRIDPVLDIPKELNCERWQRDSALNEILRARLDALGPVSAQALAESLCLGNAEVEQSLIKLETEGKVLRGQFTPGTETLEWCERRLLARIHRYTIKKLRKDIEAVTASQFLQFLFRWQHLQPDRQVEGKQALNAILEQLEGFETSASAWESDILKARIKDYDSSWIDSLCSTGKIVWTRLIPSNHSNAPIKSLLIVIMPRNHLKNWYQVSLHSSDISISGTAQCIVDVLIDQGALFFDELEEQCHLLRSQLESGLAGLVGQGLVSSDSFSGLRSLLIPKQKRRNRFALFCAFDDAGRWTLLRSFPIDKNRNGSIAALNSTENSVIDADQQKSNALEHIAKILLKRYGVIFQALLTRETTAPKWALLLPIYRRMEARGEIRGGRFVTGHHGEQFALPEAIQDIRSARKINDENQILTISASDPLNLIGIITPGKKLSALPNNRILYRAGKPLAYKIGKEIHFLEKLNESDQWMIKNRLIQNK